MTTHKHINYRFICDISGCSREVSEAGGFYKDYHLCLVHRAKVSEATLDKLTCASHVCVRETHEGGTRYLPKAEFEFSKWWDMALMEITHPLQKVNG